MRMKRRQPHAVLRMNSHQRIAYVVLRLIIALFLSVITYSWLSRIPFATPTSSFDLSMDMGGYNTNIIYAQVGQPITIRLTSLDHQYHPDGGGQHQFALDAFDVNLIAPPLGSDTVRFTPDMPGTYVYYCDTCCGGRESPTMQGTLIVQA